MTTSASGHAEQTVRAILHHRASAILRTDDHASAAPAMDAAIRAGFRIIEFTLTIPGAFDLIEQYAARAEAEGLIVGAGTVLTAEDAHTAVERGARYLVSPVVEERVIQTGRDLGAVMMPGCHTPTEMLRAHRAGAHFQKLFPAPAGGPAWVAACLGPMPFLRIVPTNGVDASNVGAFLKAGACGVGFVAPIFNADDMAAKRWDEIERRAREILDAVRAVERD